MEGIAKIIDNEADAKYFKASIGSKSNQNPVLTVVPEHLRNLHCQMGRIWHLARRLPRQTSIRLVWILDNALQPLRRLPPLLPPRRHPSLQISNNNHNYHLPPYARRRPKTPRPPTFPTRSPTIQQQDKNPRLRPPRNLQKAIHLVLRRPPTLRPPPRLPTPLHQIRLGILRRGRHVAVRPRGNHARCRALAQ